MRMKTCSKCKHEFDISCFVKSYRYNDGYYPQCKECRKDLREKRLAKNPMCSKCGRLPHLKSNPYCSWCAQEAIRRSKAGEVRKVRPQVKLCNRCGTRPRENGKHMCDVCRDFCSKCKQNKRASSSVWCHVCIREAMKIKRKARRGTWKAYYKNLTPEQKQKRAARCAFRMQVLLGKITRQPCGVCGSLKSEAHHHNGYDNKHRFDVLWFCQPHHRAYEKWEQRHLKNNS